MTAAIFIIQAQIKAIYLLILNTALRPTRLASALSIKVKLIIYLIYIFLLKLLNLGNLKS